MATAGEKDTLPSALSFTRGNWNSLFPKAHSQEIVELESRLSPLTSESLRLAHVETQGGFVGHFSELWHEF